MFSELTYKNNTAEQIKEISKCIPLGRMAQPEEQAKVICYLASEDNSYMVDSFFNKDRYSSKKNEDGTSEEHYRWVMLSKVSDGKDTLTIFTEPYSFNGWSGDVTSLHFLSSNDIEGIKRYNLAVKRACKDSCFIISVDDNKIMRVVFRMEKPKEPERPLEDYGLTKQDL